MRNATLRPSVRGTDWQPVTTAPIDRDLELAVFDRDGIHKLVFPCRRVGEGRHKQDHHDLPDALARVGLGQNGSLMSFRAMKIEWVFVAAVIAGVLTIALSVDIFALRLIRRVIPKAAGVAGAIVLGGPVVQRPER